MADGTARTRAPRPSRSIPDSPRERMVAACPCRRLLKAPPGQWTASATRSKEQDVHAEPRARRRHRTRHRDAAASSSIAAT